MPKYVPIRTQVLEEVEAFLKASGMSPSKFGQLVMADTRFVPRLRDPEGQPIKSSTIDKIRVWIPGEGANHIRRAQAGALNIGRVVKRKAVQDTIKKSKRTIKKRNRRQPHPPTLPRKRRRMVSAPRSSA